MDGFGWIVVVVVVFNIIREIAKGNAKGGTGSAPRPPKRAQPRPPKPQPVQDPDQREVWQQVLGQVPSSTSKPKKLPVKKSKWEEGVSLETAPPEPVDYDNEAEAIVQRRIAAAQARDHAAGAADHAAFDKRVREVAPQPLARDVMTPAELRRAFIWREVLGPPAALKE